MDPLSYTVQLHDWQEVEITGHHLGGQWLHFLCKDKLLASQAQTYHLRLAPSVRLSPSVTLRLPSQTAPISDSLLTISDCLHQGGCFHQWLSAYYLRLPPAVTPHRSQAWGHTAVSSFLHMPCSSAAAFQASFLPPSWPRTFMLHSIFLSIPPIKLALPALPPRSLLHSWKLSLVSWFHVWYYYYQVNYHMHISLARIDSLAYSLQMPSTEQIPGEFWVQTGNYFLLLIPRGRKIAVIVPCSYIRIFFISPKNRIRRMFQTEHVACSFAFKPPTLTIRKKALSLQYMTVFP